MNGFLKKIAGFFGGSSRSSQGQALTPEPEHAVVVTFPWQHAEAADIYALEDRLSEAIQNAGAGEFDGNELAVDKSDARLYIYGPNADKLFAAIEPELRASRFTAGMKAQLRYGPAEDGTPEKTISFEDSSA